MSHYPVNGPCPACVWVPEPTGGAESAIIKVPALLVSCCWWVWVLPGLPGPAAGHPPASGVRLGHWVRWLPLLILLLGYLLALLYCDVNIWFLNFLPSPIIYPQSVLNSLLDNIGYLLLVAASPLAEPLPGIPSPP